MQNYNTICYLFSTIRILSENKHKYFATYSLILCINIIYIYIMYKTTSIYFVYISSDLNTLIFRYIYILYISRNIFWFAYDFIHALKKYFFLWFLSNIFALNFSEIVHTLLYHGVLYVWYLYPLFERYYGFYEIYIIFPIVFG